MRTLVSRILAAAVVSALFSLTAACGGTKTEAKSPADEALAATSDDGSNAPVSPAPNPDEAALLAKDSPKSDAPQATTAVASTDNGSDIVPPFSAGKDPATKAAAPTKGAKKSGKAKKKKKPTTSG